MADSAMTLQGPDSALGTGSHPGDLHLPQAAAFASPAHSGPWQWQRTVQDDDDSARVHPYERYSITSYGQGPGNMRRSHDSAMTTGTDAAAALGPAQQLRRQDSASMQGPFGDEPEHYWQPSTGRHQQPQGASAGPAAHSSEPSASENQAVLDRAEVDSDTLMRQGSNASSRSMAEISTTFLADAAAAASPAAETGPSSRGQSQQQLQQHLPLEAQDSAMMFSDVVYDISTSGPAGAADRLPMHSPPSGVHNPEQPPDTTGGALSDEGTAVIAAADLVTPREDSAMSVAAPERVGQQPTAGRRSLPSTAGSDDSAHIRTGPQFSRHSHQDPLSSVSAAELGPARGSGDLLAEARRVVLGCRSSEEQQRGGAAEPVSAEFKDAIAEESYYHSVAGCRHDPGTLAQAREVVMRTSAGGVRHSVSSGDHGASSSGAAGQVVSSNPADGDLGPSGSVARQLSGINVGSVSSRGSAGQGMLDSPRERAQCSSSMAGLYDLD